MADQLLSAHPEWSTWWDHSWNSDAPWFSAQHCGYQLQSRDWTASSTTGRLHADSPVLHSASGRFRCCCSTQCLYHRRRCFSKDLSRRTVPPLIHGDTSGVAQRSVEFKDAAAQLSFAEFSERSILSEAPPPRYTPLPKPRDIATIDSISSTNSNSGPTPVPRTQRDCTPPPPRDLRHRHFWEFHTTSLQKQRLHAVLRPMAPVSPRRVRSLHPSLSPPYSSMSVPVGPHPSLFAAAPKETPLREATLSSVLMPVLVVDHSLRPCLPSYPWYVLAYTSHLRTATSTIQTVISCIINTVSPCFSGTQAQHARTPPILSQRLVDGFTRSSYKKPVSRATCLGPIHRVHS